MGILSRIFKRKPNVVTVHNVGGIKFRVFNDADSLPFYRASKYMELQDMAAWRMTKATIDTYQAKIIEYLDKEQYDEIRHLVGYLESIRSMDATISVVMDYVNVFILLPGEDVDVPTTEAAEKKQLFAKDPEIMDFFLSIALIYLGLVQNLRKDIKAYLMEHNRYQVEIKLSRLIAMQTGLTLTKA